MVVPIVVILVVIVFVLSNVDSCSQIGVIAVTHTHMREDMS